MSAKGEMRDVAQAPTCNSSWSNFQDGGGHRRHQHGLRRHGRGRWRGSIAAQSIKPFFLGKDPLAREQHWHDFRRYERHWHLTPIYAYGPFDIALWDIAGKLADMPLYKLLGHYREKAPTYVSSLYLDTPQDYADQALAFRQQGFHGYKLHPPRRLS